MGRPKGSLNKSTIAKMKRPPPKVMVCRTCLCCGKTNLSKDDFYTSANSHMWKETLQHPLFCKECVNKEFAELSARYGERNALVAICAILDLPFIPEIYHNIIMQTNSFSLGVYLSRLNGPQWQKRSFIQSIIDGSLGTTAEQIEEEREIRWKKAEKENRDEVIHVLGYDPFEEYSDLDRKYLFSEIIKYFDDDLAEDPYKLSQVLQIVNNNNQIRRYDILITSLNPRTNGEDIKRLNDLKRDLVSSNDKIAKENEISVKNRSNKDVGRSTLSYLMKDLRENGFEDAEANFYDQLTSDGTLWAIEMSNRAIQRNAMFDENDKQDIFQTQRQLIQSLQQKLDDAAEEKRLLKCRIAKLEGGDK